MRIVLMLLFLAAVVSFPLRARAGNIYGSLWVDGHPAQGAQIQIHCNAGHTVQTDKDGAYSVFVPENGRCNFHVDFEGHSGETPVASYANPVKYDFELVRQKDGTYSLRSR